MWSFSTIKSERVARIFKDVYKNEATFIVDV